MIDADSHRILLDWFASHGRVYPWRLTTDPYLVLMAVFMLQRTGVSQVMNVYPGFALEWEKQALTIRTEFFKPEKGRYLHPEANRPITHREAMRLQTFPDDFQWVGSRISVARQVGNAVPPELARHIALEVKAILSND